MKSFVLYHYPCADGVFAALAAYCSQKLENAVFIGHTTYGGLPQSQSLLDQMTLDDHVYLLDFIGQGDFVKQVSQKVNKVVLLDHHKTAIEYVDQWKPLPSNVEVVMDLERSGATIALDYFQPPTTSELRMKYAHVEDNDLWRHALPRTREFSQGLFAKRLEYDHQKNPEIFNQLVDLDLESLIFIGEKSLK